MDVAYVSCSTGFDDCRRQDSTVSFQWMDTLFDSDTTYTFSDFPMCFSSVETNPKKRSVPGALQTHPSVAIEMIESFGTTPPHKNRGVLLHQPIAIISIPNLSVELSCLIGENHGISIIPKPEFSGDFGEVPLFFTTIWGEFPTGGLDGR